MSENVGDKNNNPSVSQNEENNDFEYEDNTCGLGSWRPQWLQRFANMKYFLLNFSFIAVVQGSYFSYLIGCTTTLEKRFLYSGWLTGFVLIADNIAQVALSPVVGYLGKRMNKATMMAAGMVFISFSCWLTALPYFVYGPDTHLMNRNDIPMASSFHRHSHFKNGRAEYSNSSFCGAHLSEECTEKATKESATVWPAYIMIWTASFLNGIGYTAFYTLGYPYVDDNVGKKNAPIYISVISALRLLGPTTGFLLVSFCLNLSEDLTPTTMSRRDPRFIGAWWLGFMIIGLIIFLSSLPLFLFPMSLREKKPVTKKVDNVSKMVDAKAALKRIFTNPLWVFDTCAHTFRFIGYAGYYMTKPKYVESQFRVSASKANFATGAYPIVAMAGGILGGGCFVRYVKPGPRLLTTFIFVVELFANAGIILGIFFGCPRSEFFGFRDDDAVQGLSASCNVNCGCSQHVIQPVCSSDGVTNYFSPCFAGCTSMSLDYKTNLTSFGGCSCDAFGSQVTAGYCPVECNSFTPYITILSVAKFISSTSRAGNYLVRFRSIEERDKSFAMGIAMTIWGLFGAIPYPLLFGAIADSTCLIWEKSCGGKGNCWLYDSDKFRYYLHGAASTFMTIGTSFDIFVIYYSKRMTNLYDDDDEEEATASKPEVLELEIIDKNAIAACNGGKESTLL